MTKIRLDAKYDFEEYLRSYCMPTRSLEKDYPVVVSVNDGDVE